MNPQTELRRTARLVVRDCARVREKEVVLVRVGEFHTQLAELIALETQIIGASPILISSSSSYRNLALREVPRNYMSRTSPSEVALRKIVNVVVSIEPSRESTIGYLPSEAVIGQMAQAEELLALQRERKIREVFIAIPSPQTAKFLGKRFSELERAFHRSLNVNYKEQMALSKRVASKLRSASIIRIESENGTHLELSTKGRPVRPNDGVIDGEDVATDNLWVHLPAGEVYAAPLEESCNGTICFNSEIVYGGRDIRDLELHFSRGQLVKAAATEGIQLFKRILQSAAGDRDKIGEFGIGLNEGVRRFTGYTVIDEKKFGTVHIAIGNNALHGGANRSNLHWDFVLESPTVLLDGISLIERGRFTSS
jgi:aminopeptidase